MTSTVRFFKVPYPPFREAGVGADAYRARGRLQAAPAAASLDSRTKGWTLPMADLGPSLSRRRLAGGPGDFTPFAGPSSVALKSPTLTVA